ncbi:MAG TPA: amino acid ABC transporter permease, partial [Deltaproteobacteria bacterium]|nr:amino acid ABC transporter permease [Deltaproteobacteria bacterium]
YVELVRNMPLLVLVFILYFFVSDQIISFIGLDGLVESLSPAALSLLGFLFCSPAQLPVFAAGLFTLVLYEGAYITEIVRAGIVSVDKGQWEASAAIGLSRWQQMRHVILPQATRTILPPLAGQLISTIKDSAIVSVISIQELTFQGMELMAATYLTFEVWITITALYFIVTFSLSLGVRALEVSMHRY